MTVLHSRNADAADPADVADAADVKDPQDAAAEPGLREDLGRYAELGAFTLTADTHAWYAALDTVATPEDARAASSALAELRGHDLTRTWEAVTALAGDAKLEEPDTVAKTVLLVELLQRVHRTAATLTAAAYDADLDALTAATADSAWRRERGIKLSWLRARALRKQAAALATERRTRREDLHEALASAEIERRAWAALAPSGTLPTAPGDGSLVERTAQTFDAINAGLRELARVLPDHDLDGLPFTELVDLVERLAADEGTLYRLPTIHSLRTTLEEAGLGDLLAELAAAKADRRTAEAAYAAHAARQALAGGQRDGLAEAPAAAAVAVGEEAEAVTEPQPEAVTGAVTEPEASVEPVAEVQTEEVTEDESSVVSLPAPSPAADDLVAAAAAALVGPEDAPVDAEEPEAVEAVEAVEPEAVVEEIAEAAVEVAVEVEAVEVEVVEVEEPVAVEAEVTAEPAEVVSETTAEAVGAVEDKAVEVEAVEAEAVVEEIAEAAVQVAVEVEVEAVEVEVVEVEEPVAVEAEVTAEPAEAVEEMADEPEAVVEAPAVVEEESGTEAEAVEPEATVAAEPEAVEPEAVEPEAFEPEAVEPEAVEPEAVEVEVEPIAAVEAPAEASAESTPEPVAEAPEIAEVVEALVAVEAEVAEEPEPAVEPAAEAPAQVEEEPAAEAAPVEEESAGRPAKPDVTPGRPVTAYSADELLAVVRWVDGDGVERSEDELLRAAMKELGFARLGPRIKEALGAAVTAARG
ncbi:hypothetical protein PUR71_32625 [Streptomyces sp. SP17BM10]|uniref:hypothetical protein n=1 Tax=Streptomyces sp. SP17BM10 TaxID=3002530 RepID=UPI002E779C99|nr:hypothetical protein [Streptomyces sp. SP17BM10]MEE1787617.1 hypothetical protein [Streptomyces sp. SP17BM10]